MPPTEPALSVILIVGRHRDRAARALHSLLGQSVIDRLEILLFDFAAEHGALPGGDHPAVRRFERDRLVPFGQVRAEAVRLARGEIVAFLEEHCEALAGWGDAVLNAHGAGWDAVGPEIHNANPGAGASDAIAVMNYMAWLAPAHAGPSALLVGNNSSYRRQVLLDLQQDLDRLMACDPILQWMLGSAGYRLAVDPSVKVAHWNEVEARVIARGYFLWNRMFAPMRSRYFAWSPFRVFLRMLVLPAVPVVRAWRLGRASLQRQPPMGNAFLRALPVVLVAQSAAAVGMGVGWLCGAGDAETRFLRYELEEERPRSLQGAAP